MAREGQEEEEEGEEEVKGVCLALMEQDPAVAAGEEEVRAGPAAQAAGVVAHPTPCISWTMGPMGSLTIATCKQVIWVPAV
jgi:hypothetical protein